MRRLILSSLAVLAAACVALAAPVLEQPDPTGDDHGDGRFTYPSLGFEDGDLDLTDFRVENDGEYAVFTVEFAHKIRKPERGAADELGRDFTRIARQGFYQFNVDIYIDTDRRTGSGYTRLLPGRLAEVAPDDAWEVAVIATPRPSVTRGLLREVVQDELVAAQLHGRSAGEAADRSLARQQAATFDRHVVFPADFRVRGKQISFKVSHVELGGEARPDWGYTVFVTGADLEASVELASGSGLTSSDNTWLGVVPVSPGEWTGRFGGGQPGESLQPPIVDLLVPEGRSQEAVLADYDSARGRPAILPAVTGRPAAAAADEPRWALAPWQGKVGYEIFVRSFQDSDGDGIGDFRGLIGRLDYLNDGDPATDDDLGVEAIWLMPVFASPSYHGYDCIDYYRLNPQYGTEADFAELLSECHRRGIKVVLDLMLNHTSSQHPWFVDSARGPGSEKRDWYVWRADDPGWTQPWGAGPVWHERGGAYYYGIFWSGMPDLNFRNPAVVAESERIAAFWLDRGVDGFRLDAARHLVADGPGELQNDTPETHRVWREFSGFLRREYPDRLMLGEIWSGPEDVAPYYGDAARVPGGDEFAMAFDFDLAGGMIQTVNLGDKGPLEAAIVRHQAVFPAGVLDGTFLANHDMPRLATQLAEQPAKLAQAAALLLTLPGTPWLYYGEEVGLGNPRSGGDEEKRTPMPWTADVAGFTTGVPWYRFAPGQETANVAVQTGDPESLLSRYRRLIRARQQNPALARGDLRLVAVDGGGWAALAYTRSAADQRVLVVHNLADQPATLSWRLDDAREYRLLFGDRGVGTPAVGAITLPARATGVWEVR
ncbi:MAG: alpha-amylase family glycosyl hydrolase [Candidatus Krumholzibacteriia bacterium]